MRIAFLITRMDSIGGAQIHMRDISLWLKQNGHDPLVMTGARGPICETLFAAGIKVVEVQGLVRPIHLLKDIRALVAIGRALKEWRPDLPSCHSSKAGILGRIAAKAMSVPVIFTAHGWAFTDGVLALQGLVYKVIERLCRSLSDHIVTVCHYDRALALPAGIAAASRISTIHNGMPLLPPVHRDPGRDGPVRIGMVARFDAQKDHATLLRALARLRHKDWRLHLIGGGDRSSATGMAEALGLLDRIEFAGESSCVPDLLAGLDVFCLISRWEGFPRSILEAMRASLPVIASDVAGVRESVEEAVSGYVVPVGDDNLLAQRLEELIDRPTLRSAMGEKARASYEARFTIEHMLRPTLGMYRSVLAAKARIRGRAGDQAVARSPAEF
jgi:glycosyltransferase involved in cell wall biosynthesis